MSGWRLLPHVLAVAVIGGVCLPVYAADDLTPRPQRTFAEKPRIEDYADYNAFLVDIMEYRRQKQQRIDAQQRKTREAEEAAEAAGMPLQDNTLAGIGGQGTGGYPRELYEITTPETLEDALERAKKLPHPVYTEPERFGRTTAYSFPIPPIEGDDMAVGEVSGRLQDLELVNPDTFRDTGGDENAAKVLKDNPSNEDDQSEVKVADVSDALYRPFYDMATRILSGSDGKHVWIPIFIDNEAGTTIIRKLDITVDVFSD